MANSMMKSMVIRTSGGPEVLEVQERPIPEPVGREVLIRVIYSGINRPDVMQRKGFYPAPKGVVQDIPGLEVSGIVEYCGPEVTQWEPGDRVCALLAGGGYAEYVLAHEGLCLPLDAKNPNGTLTFEIGAALPETLFTVWYNVFQTTGLKAGQRLLIHGGSGGIGTTAILLACQLGVHVFTTAGSDYRAHACEELGAVEGINYKEIDFAEHWKDQRFDVILDSVAGSYFQKNLDILAADGYLVHINCTGGRKVELDILKLMQNRHHITGSTMRARTDEFKESLRDNIRQQVWPLVFNGQFMPVIQEIIPYQNAAEGHRKLENQEVFGKILLSWA